MESMGQTGMGTSTRSRIGAAMIHAVLRAEDYERAKRFYNETLGLRVQEVATEPGMRDAVVWMDDGRSGFELYERPGLRAPENTVLTFDVSEAEFDATLDDLRAHGVQFQDYDIPEMGLKTTNGVATFGDIRMAWFLDTEGNILAIDSSRDKMMQM